MALQDSTFIENQMENSFGLKTQKFLAALEKESTKNIYTSGMKVFQTFYNQNSHGTIEDFLNRLDEDLLLPPGKRSRVGTTTLREFIVYMKNPPKEKADSKNSTSAKILKRKKPLKPLSNKTINCYVSSVRSLVSFIYDYEYNIPVRGIGLPNPEVISSKNPWTLESISKFLKPMKPRYKALGACIFQSGQGLQEILSLSYGDIQSEFERGTRPLMLTLKRQKTGVQYVSFLGSVSLDLLTEYFKEEGKPKSHERLFPIEEETVERYFSRRARKLIKPEKESQSSQEPKTTKPWKCNCPMRPHSLRSAFEKLLVKGHVSESYCDYMMGHKINALKDAYIISGMSPEEWRQEYRNFEKFLTFEI
jgi:integrase